MLIPLGLFHVLTWGKMESGRSGGGLSCATYIWHSMTRTCLCTKKNPELRIKMFKHRAKFVAIQLVGCETELCLLPL